MSGHGGEGGNGYRSSVIVIRLSVIVIRLSVSVIRLAVSVIRLANNGYRLAVIVIRLSNNGSLQAKRQSRARVTVFRAYFENDRHQR